MADPKYAGLPGIAPPDEKDVYETEDLPEADQDVGLSLQGEPETEAISRPHIDVRHAYEKFRGKHVIDWNGVDFSDRVRPRGHYGYYAINGEWELAAPGEPETILQKYHRLQTEMNSLIEDINKVSAQDKDQKAGEVVFEQSLVPNLEKSLEHLKQIKLVETVGSAAYDSRDDQIKKLMAQVVDLKKSETKEKKDTKNAPELVVKYNLQSLPSNVRFQHSSRLADLEGRLKQLETILGTSTDNMNRLQISEFDNVCEAVAGLNARLSILDANTVDRLDTRLGNLLARMDSVNEKRGGQQLCEIESKVSELYESYKKTEALTQSLVPVADRLATLTQLHQEAGDFRKNLTDLKADSNNIATSILGLEAELKNAKNAMEQILKTVTNNIASFNERLSSLSK